MNLRWLYSFFWHPNLDSNDVANNEPNATSAVQSGDPVLSVQLDAAIDSNASNEIENANQVVENNLVTNDQVNESIDAEEIGVVSNGADEIVAVSNASENNISNGSSSAIDSNIGVVDAQVNDRRDQNRLRRGSLSYARALPNASNHNQNIRPTRIRRRTDRFSFNVNACVMCDKPFVSSVGLSICARCQNHLK